jgi:hypothetical protein
MSQIPMPPLEFQALVCGPGGEPRFEEVGSWLRDALDQQGMQAPGTNFLVAGGSLANFWVLQSGHTSASTDIRAWWTGAPKKSPRVIRAFASITST